SSTSIGLTSRDLPIAARDSWLCMLPCISNDIWRRKDTELFQEFCRDLSLALQELRERATDSGVALVIKLHPMDEMYLTPSSKQQLFQYGVSYTEFCNEFDIDQFLEPSLYSFNKFIVINKSSATRYIKLLHGDSALIAVNV